MRTAWLQVREDNPVAYRLYLSLGFIERMRRTTWQANPTRPIPHLGSLGVAIRSRRVQDWPRQLEWLRRVYPSEVTRNLSVSFSHFAPGLISQFMRWIQGAEQENWAAWHESRALSGFLSWEPSQTFSDPLWLAVPEDVDPNALTALLIDGREVLAYRNRPLQVNFFADQASSAFHEAGFEHHQTLIWMFYCAEPVMVARRRTFQKDLEHR